MNLPNHFFRIKLILLVAAAALLSVPQAWAQQGLSPMQVAKTNSVGSIAFSNDANYIAYTLSVPADPTEQNKPATSELHLYDLRKGSSVPYYTDTGVRSVHFRPAHNTITFLAKKEGDNNTSLYEISVDGGEAQKLYAFKTSIAGYDWAPDGNHLAFMAAEPREEVSKPLPYQPEIYEENLVQRRGYITNVYEADHGTHRIQVDGSIYQIHWGPHGERLAVAAAPTSLVDDFYMSQQVYIVNHSGEEILGRVEHQGKLGQIGWSPDGSKLAMIAGADLNDPVAGRLMVVSSDGGSPTLLKEGFKGMVEQFQWKNSTTLRYLASQGVWSSYGVIHSDGSGDKTLVGTGGPILESFAACSGGKVAFTAQTPNHPSELYLMKSSYDTPKRLTNSNPWLDDVSMGSQELVTWKARDGKELEGLLIKPVGYMKGQTYPVITVVHGGPESHYDNGWLTSYSQAGQMGAARGYAVFYPNYRGSTGRGLEFAMSSQGDLAGAEFDDIVDGVDYLVEQGIANPEKVGVTGGSYGGYATGWLSTRYTERFAAGVMFVGISDNISKWGTSDIPEELYLVHARKRIWDDYQFFLERSPIYHAGQAKTPLLIMAGKEDTRVDPSQSYELYRHIKTRTDTPVRLVLYPGEGHGNVNATARFDYNLRMLRWFGQYLKGESNDRPDTELELQKVGISN